MKRKLLIFAALLLFCGCERRLTTEEYRQRIFETLRGDYTLSGTLTFCGTPIQIQAEKSGQTCRIFFAEPSPFDGLTLWMEGETTTLTMGELTMTLPTDALPGQGVPAVLRLLLTGGMPEELRIRVEGETVTAEGSVMLNAYRMTFDEKTLALRSLELSTLDTTLTASAFSRTEAQTMVPPPTTISPS